MEVAGILVEMAKIMAAKLFLVVACLTYVALLFLPKCIAARRYRILLKVITISNYELCTLVPWS